MRYFAAIVIIWLLALTVAVFSISIQSLERDIEIMEDITKVLKMQTRLLELISKNL